MTTLANLTTYFAGESSTLMSAIEQSRGGLRRLIAELDPVSAATDRFNKRQEMLDNALKRSRVTMEQHAILTQRLRAAYDQQMAGQGRLTQSTGQMRAGMQQLSYQVGDVAQQFALGTSPMIIFAQQGGQVMQAVQMMSTSSKGFIGFMAGPWGQVLTAAAVVVAALSMKLFENAEASKTAELANDGLSEAQSALGKMFDLTTGKLQKQNEMLRLNALLTAQNLKVEAAAARSRVDTAAKGAEFGTLDKVLSVLSRRGNMIEGAEGAGQRVSATLRGVLDGKVDAYDAAKSVKAGDLGILGISKSEFETSLRDAVESRFKSATATEIEKTLNTGVLSPIFREEGRDKKTLTPKDRSAQREERYLDELARLQDEHLTLTSQLTTDARQRAQIAHERIEAEVEAYRKDQDLRILQKEITAEQAKALVAQKEANAEKEHAKVNRQLDAQLDREDLDLKRAQADNAITILQLQLGAARSQEERRRIQLRILDYEAQVERAVLEGLIASKDVAEAEKERARLKLAQIDQERGMREAAIGRDTMGPLAEYMDRLPKSAAELNEAYQRVAADGLEALNDGLVDAIMNTKSLGDVFNNIANQIIADLLRIAIQKSITAPLASMLGMGGDGGGGGGFNFFGLLGGAGGTFTPASGPGALVGTTTFSSIPRMAKGGSLLVGGMGGVDNNVLSINGMPRALVSSTETVNVTPANDRGLGVPPMVFDMRGAVLTADLLAQVNELAASRSAEVVGIAGRRAARRGSRRTG